ncbi:transcription initiation factor TFIID subunit 4-like isoform X2 [Denticeps clupeoides]|uniref:transcription initiation factor TFIID subunit 4-like isoform X2 n=1 Tax=Denticeps clupeoides TaxID=299321 RepID=UPI0010A58C16|nr:transcription initiation factor TFIID subunit 4 isoform X2 [Denticeps clupeoides]
MAAGSDLLDDVFFNTEVDEKVVSDIVGSLESELTGASPGDTAVRARGLGNHVSGAAGSANSNVQDNKVGLAQELVKAGAGVPGGVINNTRSQAPAAELNPARTGAGGRGAADGRKASPGAPTLNGGSVVMNSHTSVSVPAAPATPSAGPAVPPVNNGPGTVVKGHGAALPPSSGTVIQTSLLSTTSTVISQTSCAGPAVTLVRPPMQAAGPVGTPNGSGGSVLTAGVAVAHLPLSSATAAVTSGLPVNKSESPKAAVPTTVLPGSAGAPVAKSPVLQNAATRASVPPNIAASPATIRAIAPQVLAPRLPNAQPGTPNIQNIQLPPGMVLVRSESGQLLMIHQQTLAQMQAQNAMAPRPATPTSTPPVQIASAPGTPIITRQITPTTIIKQTQPAQPTVQAATTSLQRPPVLQETLENVKKCKNFLSTLIKLASSGKQSSETAANVKELVKDLLEGKIEAEDFTSRLYRELNSSPQPYLVPFLKRSLPALRQMTPDSASFIQQSQLQQPSTQPTSTALTAVVLGGSATQRTAIQPAPTVVKTPSAAATAATATTPAAVPVASAATTTPHPPVISLAQSKPSLILQQPQQQGAMVRPQVSIAQTPMVTLRGQPQNRMFVPQTVVKQLPAVSLLKPGQAPGAKMVSVSAGQPMGSVLQKNKLKEAGGSFKDDDDINDVASMAGVNLSEESARILATNSDLVGAVMRSCKDEAFLYTSSLNRRMLEIGRKYGVNELGPEVINFVSHATQQRLKNLLEKVSEIAQQKNLSYKEDERYDQASDVRTQLKFFEQLDQAEKQRKEEQEREMLMKAAKSRSRQEDPEQARLKQKAKEMQQQELAQMRQRDANLTALAAIGPRKKRKLDLQTGGAVTEGSTSGSAASGASGSGVSRQFTRQRITRVNLRDLLFCLENERETSHSHLLYKAFLK